MSWDVEGSATRATSRHIQLLICDGGTEYINNYLKNQLSLLGIQLQTSATYTPERNGIAKRDHRSTVESTRSQIHAKGVPLKLWAEAINYSVYVLNRTISKSEIITPYQRWFGKSPDFRIFAFLDRWPISLRLMFYVRNFTLGLLKASTFEKVKNIRRLVYLLKRLDALTSQDILKYMKTYHIGLRLLCPFQHHF